MNARKLTLATMAVVTVLGLVLVGCGPAAQPIQPPAPTRAVAPSQPPTPTAVPPTAAPEATKLPLEGVTLTLSRWAGDPWEAGY